MFSRLREHFGTAGLIVAIVALVAALGGGAYAASGGSGGGKATASAKAKQGKQGKPGKTGPAGPAGPAGPQGPQGAAGAGGKDGANGTNGANGAAGKSVVLGTAGAECPEGGTTVEVAGEPATKKSICNGVEGPQGNTGNAGSPWTVGGTLPVGATETGRWSLFTSLSAAPDVNPDPSEELRFAAVTLSFPIALASSPAAHYEGEPNFADFDEGGSGTVGCKGSFGDPTAPSGNLCVYGGVNPAAATLVQLDASKVGGQLNYMVTGEVTGAGSWAVTG